MKNTALTPPLVIFGTWAKARESLRAYRATVYVCVILLAVLIAYAYELRTRTIFACPADGYSADRYVAYCNAVHYADYEHGAFQFGLEPSAQDFAGSADVLFLGNSRLQVALSTVATANWFSTASVRYYLLGFGYSENVTFTEKVLQKVRPRAKVYVINVDDFFDRSESLPTKMILHDPQAQNLFERKRLWQRVHEPICKTLSLLCGQQAVIFRSRETGAYYREGLQTEISPVSYHQAISEDVVNRNTAVATDFLSRFAEGKCVILTMVPNVGTKVGDAEAIAAGLGVELVTPGVLEGLQTYDGSHLDRPSAERWSRAFFQAAGPKIRSCLEKQDIAHP
jgi:hypothetical protein